MIEVRIPNTVIINDYCVYNIEIIITVNQHIMNSYTSSKRFSDFFGLRKELETEFDNKIPYSLPSRFSSFYKNSDRLIEDRRIGLIDFTERLMNDHNLRNNPMVLNFFNIPKSALVDPVGLRQEKEKKNLLSLKSTTINSVQKWMEVLKDVKSLLQDVRTKMFSHNNIVEIKAIMKPCESQLEGLREYLSEPHGLGAGEIRRRKELLNSLVREFNELNSLIAGLSVSHAKGESYQNVEKQQDQGGLYKTVKARRQLGKPRETEVTKKLDNNNLLQLQKDTIAKQDQDLNSLHEVIYRQKQIGTAINEELVIQNELLQGLNDQADQSSRKMKHAKNNIGKIL